MMAEDGVLTALGVFHFLTTPQLERLEVGSAAYLTNTILPRLVRKQLIACFQGAEERVRVRPSGGADRFGVKAPRVFFLTPRGARYLAAMHKTDPGAYPSHAPGYTFGQYRHRVALIDVWIELQRHGEEILFFDTDFEMRGQRKKTRIDLPGAGYHIPDAIFQTPTGLFLLEIQVGGDLRRLQAHLGQHFVTMRDRVLVNRYGRQGRGLFVFVPAARDHEQGDAPAWAALQKTQEWLQADPRFSDQTRPFFGFATLAQLKTDFRLWWDFRGQRLAIF